MSGGKRREIVRWLVWVAAALILVICGRNLLHLKYMEWFLLFFSLGCGGLVLTFRGLGNK